MSSTQLRPGSRAAPGSHPTSPSLIARVRSRDAEAWNQLVALYAPFVYRQCRGARLSAEDAADVFQEVFQAAFARITSFGVRRRGDTFRGWLRTIARNKVRDHYRLRRREPRAVGGSEMQAALAQVAHAEPDTDTDSEAGSRCEADAENELLRDALEAVRPQFHERTWRAFLGTAVDGRPPADVGAELSMSPGAVRVAKSRVLQRLRAALGDGPL